MGAFEKDACLAAVDHIPHGIAALARFDREESTEAERMARKSGSDERCQNGGWTGQDIEWDICLEAGLNEPVARIGNPGHAGIADEGDAFTCFGRSDEFGGFAGFVVFVQ